MGDQLSRRKFLGMAVTGAAGLVLGNFMDLPHRVQGVLEPQSSSSDRTPETPKTASATEPFLGVHQSGIVTPSQKFITMAAFDLTTDDRNEVKELLRIWTTMISRMMEGEAPADGAQNPKFPPVDTGEEIGLEPARLTVTVGFGMGLFVKDGVDRFGLSSKKPKGLKEMPKFHKDALQDMYTHGDIVVQACADDPILCFHAIRNLSIAANGVAHLRWQQSGQWGMKPEGTPRNLFGFKDGTNNPQLNDDEFMNRNVWIAKEDEPAWLAGGTYMVVRRIQMRIETWDQISYKEQENVIGRQKVSGAPMDGQTEFEQPKFSEDLNGAKTALDSHIRLSNPRDGERAERERILRRGFNFMEGLDKVGRMNAGLLFICFNRSIENQFESIQKRLANPNMPDQLLAYTQTTGGGYYVVPPGVQKAGSFLGEGLFA